MKIKFVSEDGFEPARATDGSAGFDLRSTDSDVISPGYRKVFGTGVSVAIPPGFVGKVYSRSGHGFKHGVSLANGTGIIDSDYRGEIKVSLVNKGHDFFEVKRGDRIAQIVFEKLPDIEMEKVTVLDVTERGNNGFGSTGNE